MSRCKSCGRRILWAITANRKRMPLDADPVKRAVLTGDTPDGPLVEIKDTYQPHFVTCVDAEAWRRKEEEARG